MVGSLYEAWQLILAVDYRPVFESACEALHAPTQDSAWAREVRGGARVALQVSRSAASARHDLLGRIFHRLLNTARYDGSFYTSTAAAAVLAGLAIESAEDLPEDLAAFRVIDPACGTGTLLMAAAERIRDLPERRLIPRHQHKPRHNNQDQIRGQIIPIRLKIQKVGSIIRH